MLLQQFFQKLQKTAKDKFFFFVYSDFLQHERMQNPSLEHLVFAFSKMI